MLKTPGFLMLSGLELGMQGECLGIAEGQKQEGAGTVYKHKKEAEI